MNKPIWTLVERKASDLIPYANNPRIIKGKAFQALRDSMATFGLMQPIIINTDNVIIGGHARWLVSRETSEDLVLQCYMPDRTLTEAEVKEANIRLNKNVAGQWDFEILANVFDMDELKSWGFEDHDFGKFSFGSENQQGNLDETGGGETKLYTCPNCNHQWKPEKKKKDKK